jgi:hypothetical protein
MAADDIWGGKADEEVLAAAAHLYDYTEEGDRLIRAELIRRGLPEAPPAIGACVACGRSIPANHPPTTCQQCETPFPADIVGALLAAPPLPAAIPAHEPLRGIRGWLLLPAISLALGAVVSAVNLIQGISWYPQIAAAGLGLIHTVDLTLEILCFGLLLLTAVRFAGEKRNAPRLFIILLIARVVVPATVGTLAVFFINDVILFASGAEATRAILYGAIWIPYFIRSRRVKATFVN